MNKLHKFYVVLIIFQLVHCVCTVSFGQNTDTANSPVSRDIFAIQIAASREFIEPEFFRQELHLTDSVKYFRTHKWYKYVIGSYITEPEALVDMRRLKIEGYVISLTGTGLEISHPNTQPAQKIIADSVQGGILESEKERLYISKIREADSLFNLERNLLQARICYEEASLLAPDKNYARDQMLEIDKQLIDRQKRSFFSNWRSQIYIIAGIAVLLLLIGIIVLNIRRIKRIPKLPDSQVDQPVPYDPKNIDLILQLYPELAIEMPTVLIHPYNDPVIIRLSLERCLNSADLWVRLEAELAWMRLVDQDPFSFLDQLKVEFSSLEQLHVFEYIRANQVIMPDFSRWDKSPNLSVVRFCRQMNRAFGKDGASVPRPDSLAGMINDFVRIPENDLDGVADQLLAEGIRDQVRRFGET